MGRGSILFLSLAVLTASEGLAARGPAWMKYYEKGDRELSRMRPGKALGQFQRARKLAGRLREPHHLIVDGYFAAGAMYSVRGDQNRARKALLDAVGMAEEIYGRSHPSLEPVLTSLAAVEVKRKRYADAWKAVSRSLAILEKEEKRDEDALLSALAVAREALTKGGMTGRLGELEARFPRRWKLVENSAAAATAPVSAAKKASSFEKLKKLTEEFLAAGKEVGEMRKWVRAQGKSRNLKKLNQGGLLRLQDAIEAKEDRLVAISDKADRINRIPGLANDPEAKAWMGKRNRRIEKQIRTMAALMNDLHALAMRAQDRTKSAWR